MFCHSFITAAQLERGGTFSQYLLPFGPLSVSQVFCFCFVHPEAQRPSDYTSPAPLSIHFASQKSTERCGIDEGESGKWPPGRSNPSLQTVA